MVSVRRADALEFCLVFGTLLLAGCSVKEKHLEPGVDASLIDASQPVDAPEFDGAPPVDAPAVDAALPVDARAVDASSLDAAIDAMPPPDSAGVHIVPTFAALATTCDTVATTVFAVSAPVQLNTSSSPLCGVVAQSGAPEICVLRYGSISVSTAATLAVTGQRVIALIADGDLTIDGTVDASAVGVVDGPGSRGVSIGAGTGTGASTASNPAAVGETNLYGGGGAGGRTVGGSGSSATAAVNGDRMNGGAQITGAVDGPTIAGGTHPASNPSGSLGGGGGGAVVLISCRGTVSVTGTVAANGGGGRPGADVEPSVGNTVFTSGSGGGAGGVIVLQGAGVSVTGRVFANGGGGGSGAPIDNQSGTPGMDGQSSMMSAAGGSLGNAGDGGRGGTAAVAPGIGSRPAGGGATSGGGGGSVGFIATFTPVNVTPTVTPMEASPSVDANRILLTQ